MVNLDDLFEGFIEKSYCVKEQEIVPGFMVKVKALDTGTIAAIENKAFIVANGDEILESRLARLYTLAEAVLAINGNDIYGKDDKEEEITEQKNKLYTKFKDSAPDLVDGIYYVYSLCVKEQNEYFGTWKKQVEAVEKQANTPLGEDKGDSAEQ